MLSWFPCVQQTNVLEEGKPIKVLILALFLKLVTHIRIQKMLMTVTGKRIPVIFSLPLCTNHSVSGFHVSLSTHTAVTHSSFTHCLQQGLQVGELLVTHSWLLLDFTINPLKSLESGYDQNNQIKSRGKWMNCPPQYLIAKRPSRNTSQSSQQNLHNTYRTLRCSRYSSLWGSVTKAISHLFSTDFNSSNEKVGSSWLSHAHYSATYVPRGGQKCLSYKEVRSAIQSFHIPENSINKAARLQHDGTVLWQETIPFCPKRDTTLF